MANAGLNEGGMDRRREPGAAGRHAVANARRRRLADWFATPVGSRVLSQERPLVQEAVRRFHGDSLLWIGATADLLDTTSQCMVRARICTACGMLEPGTVTGFDGNRNDMPDIDLVAADTAELPFATGSIEGVVLHHALEVVANRRGTLREAARVLRSGGRLVVIGFNPFSLWLLIRPLAAFRDLRPLSVMRLGEWLAVLGLTREAPTVYLNYRSALPMAPKGDRWRTASDWLNRLQPPLGGAYVLVATKQGYVHLHQRRDPGQSSRKLAPVALQNATRQADRIS